VAARYSQQKKKVLISGASGFVGRELSSFLSSQGHDVTAVTRGKSSICGKTLSWDLYQDGMNLEELEGFDVMIHLAGESIAEKRWSKSQKSKIFQSRSRNTWLLSQTLSRIKRPPRTFISASAVGIYGDCMDSIVDEKSPYAHDFLADVCIHWERASECLSEKGIRRCLARFGYILSPQGGMLAKMLPSFRLFFGARLGTSEQWMPWVALDDVVYSLYHMMMREDLEGPFNITAPEPLRQGLFASCLAKALHRPLWLKVSAPILRLVLNERADALLLRSCRALPCRLLKSGYTFCFSTLDKFFSAYF
jgi:uncharacterized protein (TIGR01777 family)